MPLCRNFSNIDKKWILTRGYKVVIGIIDGGFDLNNKNIVIREFKSFGRFDGRHGSAVSSIIASKGERGGLSSKSELVLAEISSYTDFKYQIVEEALNWIKDKNIDVLNLSFAYKKNYKSLYDILVEISKNTLIFAAYSKDLEFPHSYEEIISVGTKKEDMSDVVVYNRFMTNLSGINATAFGSSFATAYLTSVGALAKSYDKTIDKGRFLNEICGEKTVRRSSDF